MKKNIILSVLTFAVSGLVTTSCSDFLDKEYDASLSQEKVFNNASLTMPLPHGVYITIPRWAAMAIPLQTIRC